MSMHSIQLSLPQRLTIRRFPSVYFPSNPPPALYTSGRRRLQALPYAPEDPEVILAGLQSRCGPLPTALFHRPAESPPVRQGVSRAAGQEYTDMLTAVGANRWLSLSTGPAFQLHQSALELLYMPDRRSEVAWRGARCARPVCNSPAPLDTCAVFEKQRLRR